MFKPGEKVQIHYRAGVTEGMEITHGTITEVLSSTNQYSEMTLVKRADQYGHTSDSEIPSWWVRNEDLILAPPEPRSKIVGVKIKKLSPNVLTPEYQTDGAAGFDLHALQDVVITPGETKLIKTGLAFEIPLGFEMQIRPRSGISLKTKLRVANSPGTVDADFRAEVCIIMTNTGTPSLENSHVGYTIGDDTICINAGDRIAQGVICPVYQASFEEVDELSSTDRGAAAFGSTGK